MRSTSPAPLPFLRSYPSETHTTKSTWFLRATAISASWLALAGYTFFSLLISPTEQLRWSTDVLAALGSIALTSGYLGGLIAFYFARTLAFRLDSVILPLLLSSVGGLFAIILNWALHREIQTGKAYVYAPLGVACVSTVACASAALYLNTQRKIQVAVEDARQRHLELVSAPPHSSWGADASTATAGTPFLDHPAASTSYDPHQQQQQHQSSYHRNSYDSRQHTPHYPDSHGITTTHAPPRAYNLQTMPLPPPLRHMSSTELRPIEMNIPEDEAQRRQLLRLLIAKEQSSPSPGDDNTDVDDPNHPGAARNSIAKDSTGGIGTNNSSSNNNSTYRIDWPGSALLDERSAAGPPPPRPSSMLKGGDGGAVVDLGPFPPPPVTEAVAKQREKEEKERRRESKNSNGGGNEDGEISNRWSIGNLLGRRRGGAGGLVVDTDGGASRDDGGNAIGGGVEDEERRVREIEELAMRQREERERRRREIEAGD